jgi:hypothetical protein
MNKSESPKQIFSSMKLIHLALLMGQILFAGVVTFLLTDGMERGVNEQDSMTFLIVAFAVTLSSLMLGKIVSETQIRKIAKKEKLSTKLSSYRTAKLVRYAPMEGASLLCTAIYLLTADYYFITIAVGIIIFFILLRPTLGKTIEELELDRTEIEELQN